MNHMMITDPKYRRLRKALRRAEVFIVASDFSERARGRWNKIVNRAIRLGAL